MASGKLLLPKIGDGPVRWSRPLPPEPSRVTVIKEPRQGRRAGGDGPRSAGKTGEQVRAQRSEAGTHPKLRRDAAQAGLSTLQGGEEVKEVR